MNNLKKQAQQIFECTKGEGLGFIPIKFDIDERFCSPARPRRNMVEVPFVSLLHQDKGSTTWWEMTSLKMNSRNTNNDVISDNDIIGYMMSIHCQ